MQALLDVTQNMKSEERDQLYERLLNNEKPIELIPPSGLEKNEYSRLALDRLKHFRILLNQKLKRQAKKARKKAQSVK